MKPDHLNQYIVNLIDRMDDTQKLLQRTTDDVCRYHYIAGQMDTYRKMYSELLSLYKTFDNKE